MLAYNAASGYAADISMSNLNIGSGMLRLSSCMIRYDQHVPRTLSRARQAEAAPLSFIHLSSLIWTKQTPLHNSPPALAFIGGVSLLRGQADLRVDQFASLIPVRRAKVLAH